MKKPQKKKVKKAPVKVVKKLSKPQLLIKEKKIKYLEYFRQLPIQKLAAASVGVNEDTIIVWKGKDSDFSDQVENAKAEWAMENAKGVKSKEWLLERLMNNHFGEKKSLDVTSDGLPIQVISYKDIKK